MDHPVVTGLAEHLTREHAHVELTKLSQHLTDSTVTEEEAASVTCALRVPRTLNAGFEVTLVDDTNEDDEIYDDDDDESMEEDVDDDDDVECDYIGTEQHSDTEESSEYEAEEEAEVTEALMADPELRRQLLRFVYQGCDLFAAPQQQQPMPPVLYPGLVLQL